MLLHRRIDYFTDTHPLFIKSKRNFYEGFERYSSVLVDIYYDYLLAKNFEKFSDVSLDVFTKNIYVVLQKNKQYLPESALGFLNYVIKNNTEKTFTSWYPRVRSSQSECSGKCSNSSI